MKKLIVQIKARYKNYVFGMSYPYDENGNLLKKVPKPNVFGFLFDEAIHFISTLQCRLQGHDLQEEVINADCGHTYMECSRCGRSWSHYM